MRTALTAGRGRGQESGQAMLFIVLGLGIFLLGAMAFAIDLSNAWFRRQAAQTAADAACTAGAMDMLVNATNGTTNQGHFNGGSTHPNFDCFTSRPYSNSTSPAPCLYAALNGFDSNIVSGSTAI